jgi:pimeloyl-ACP methyl ester carboxylesterase
VNLNTRILLVAWTVVNTACLLAGAALAADDAAPPQGPRAAIARSQSIAPGGIHELKTVEIGGIQQWISVRGNDAANPILLFIHGGPGSPMMPVSWSFQRPWEDFFTVVQWDQRGAGKTFASAGRKPDESMTIDRMQADAEEMIEYLRRTYHQDKIVVMAHSWGSILGIRIAQHHPEWLYAYVGVGQVVNARRNETVSYRETLARAQAAADTAAIRELKSIAPYPGTDANIPLQKVFVERKWVVALGGMMYARSDADETQLRAMSPDYSDDDVAAVEDGEMSSVQILLPQSVDVNFDNVTRFKCPVFFFAGRDDEATPASIVHEYFGRIQAPEKKLFVVDRAAHYVVNEAPGIVLTALVRYVRPLTQPHRN